MCSAAGPAQRNEGSKEVVLPGDHVKGSSRARPATALIDKGRRFRDYAASTRAVVPGGRAQVRLEGEEAKGASSPGQANQQSRYTRGCSARALLETEHVAKLAIEVRKYENHKPSRPLCWSRSGAGSNEANDILLLARSAKKKL